MLRKLTYHEFEATVRQYLPLYVIMLGVCTLTYLIYPIKRANSLVAFIPTLLFGISVLAMVCTFVIGLYLPAVRFYKNMLGSEGYLTFTLPVKVRSLVISKLIVSCFWLVLTMILCIGSAEVIINRYYNLSMLSFISTSMSNDLSGSTSGVITLFVICMIVSVLCMPITYYASVALGQILSRNKLLGSIAGYFIISFGVQIIMIILMLIATFIIGFSNIEEFINSTRGISAFMILVIALQLVLSVVGYFFTVRLMKTKLNLE